MQNIYFENDDILQIRILEKPVVREISQGLNTNVSYAEDGSLIEIVLLNAKKAVCCWSNTEKRHK